MKLIRSEVRHTCFRKKNDQPYKPSNQYIIDMVEEKMTGEKWEDFSDEWDVFVKGDLVEIIIPESDTGFITSACVKIKTMVEMGLDIDEVEAKLTNREMNVYEIVNLNYAGRDVPWKEFNETWGVEVDHNAKRFQPIRKNTQRNEVEIPEPPSAVVPSIKIDTNIELDDFRPVPDDQLEAFKYFMEQYNKNK